MKKQNNKNKVFRKGISGFFKHLMFILLSLVTLFPIYFIFVTAFKSKTEFMTNKISIPQTFVFENFIVAFRDKVFLIWTANTLILTFGTIIISVLFSIFAAYAFLTTFPILNKVLYYSRICLSFKNRHNVFHIDGCPVRF